MSQPTTLRASQGTILWNKIKTFFSKPHNVILLLLGIVLTFTTVAPIVAIVEDTFKIHAGTIDAHLTGQASGYTTVNYTDLFHQPHGQDQPVDASAEHRSAGCWHLPGVYPLSADCSPS